VFLVGLGQSGAESGLGISVKGKTSVSDSLYRDLGLYVKSILDGGAAAKVCTSCFTLCSYLRQRRRYVFLPVFVCLSVCLLARLLKNVHGFG